jgi:hypothetical protein
MLPSGLLLKKKSPCKQSRCQHVKRNGSKNSDRSIPNIDPLPAKWTEAFHYTYLRINLPFDIVYRVYSVFGVVYRLLLPRGE